MNGEDCPIHKTPMWLLATTNEWIYYCKTCDCRYNERMEPMPTPYPPPRRGAEGPPA